MDIYEIRLARALNSKRFAFVRVMWATYWLWREKKRKHDIIMRGAMTHLAKKK